jgi:hypothetical protein
MAYPSANWTIMVYISADDVLANFAVESLKQLRDAAGDGIVVLAQFDANQHRDTPIYLFDGKQPNRATSSIENSRVATIADPVDMTLPATLTQFIDYASETSKTERYCLVLWGHGTELLLDQERRRTAINGTGSANEPERAQEPDRAYLTYPNLKKALRDTKLAKGQLGPDHPKSIADARRSQYDGRRHTLDILGIDACSMSMVELASELQDDVDYMVASQEDVPDASFPYQKILSDLKDRDIRQDVRKVCKVIPGLYHQAFRDYIASPGTGVKAITLASLDLTKVRTITDPLTKLASALLSARYDESMRQKIVVARSEAQDYDFGLFVDLCDFCERLGSKLNRQNITDIGLASSCKAICDAIKVHEDGCVIENQPDVKQNRSHGLSIYFPYRTEDETEEVQEALAKGGSRQPLKGGSRQPLKGGSRQPLKGGSRQPLKERTARIQELEADFAHLDEFRRTGWDEFIKQGWSFILANETPFQLDTYYSAEQCVANLLSLCSGRRDEKAA